MALSPDQELELLLLVEAEGEQSMSSPTKPQQSSTIQQIGQAAIQHGPMAALGQATQMAFEKGGENLAQNLASGVSPLNIPGIPLPLLQPTPGKGLRISPEFAAGIGTAIQIAPDIAMSIPMGGGAVPVAKAGVGMLTKGASTAGKVATAGSKLAGLEERLLMQQEALGGLGERVAQRGAKLVEEKTALGQAIGKVEELGGYSMKQMPEEFHQILDNPKELAEMGTRLRHIADTPINKLTDALSTNQLQHVRKFAQFVRENGRAVSKDLKANIAMGGHQAGKALRQVDEVFDSVISKWENVDQKIRTLKDSKGTQKAAIQSAIRQTRQAIRESKRLVAMRKTAVQVGGTIAGLGYIGNVLSKLVGG